MDGVTVSVSSVPMLFPAHEIEALRAQAAHGPAQLVGATSVDPTELARAAAVLFRQVHVVLAPDGEMAVGLGEAWSAAVSGETRFEQLFGAMESQSETIVGPYFSGFSFHPDGPQSPEWDGFPAATAVLPQIAIFGPSGNRTLVVNAEPIAEFDTLLDLLGGLERPGPAVPFDPGDHSVESRPPSAEWRADVEEAIDAIGLGGLSKVVLSRSVVVTSEIAPSAFELIDHLRQAYPQCYVFARQVGASCFVGASPELLLEKRGTAVRLNPLAGTARRGEGEAEDRALGEALLRSKKDREEHALVVDDVSARLGPLLKELHVPAAPSLRRMAAVQHLSTEIDGEASEEISPLTLIDAMVPTPAVGGTPRAAALTFIDKVEVIDRGWFTGGLGWITTSGDAVFAIPLRCALLRGETAYLYAGAGIVAASEPESELDETRLKFRPMLSLLTAT